MNKYGYAREKFGRAIYTLAVGAGDIRARLLVVFTGDLLMINPDHLPERFRKDYLRVIKQVTRQEESFKGQRKQLQAHAKGQSKWDYLLPSNIEASIFRMRCKTGSKIACLL